MLAVISVVPLKIGTTLFSIVLRSFAAFEQDSNHLDYDDAPPDQSTQADFSVAQYIAEFESLVLYVDWTETTKCEAESRYSIYALRLGPREK
ncbi:hypothetical protein V1520DRAFT_344203 [Lipomyces starkeyi]|uniref:Uncharacterized protein n=1 Tax=Lipomyces starkeyi NRRL Y-11557 TaxID=675824 RepID=A0A1E3Q8Q7_LIPST|nr:hypothetical protein LIPSTDRAFT_69586 [Lipomyces starkeyi NRRL Y-11557]